jgi:glyoxylase-like metal-dependent hydrolase (beta-lactamase superfamily II)
MNPNSRRGFIKLAAGSAAGAALWSAAGIPSLAWAKADALAATSLADGIVVISGAGANVLAVRGSEGLLLVDGGLAARSSELLSLALKQTGTRKVHTLFNSHWHPEQTGSNERLGKEGVRIIAHENTRLWLTRKIVTDWLPKGYGPLPAKSLPNKSFYTRESLEFGGETLDYGHLGQAHTDGDLFVYLHNANVLAAGGVVSAQGWPVMDWQTGGWIGGLVGAYDRLLKVANEQTRIVPANGPVLLRKDLQTHRDMYFTIFDRLVKLLVKGQGPEEVVAAKPAQEFEAEWGPSDTFVNAAFKSLWGHYAPDA